MKSPNTTTTLIERVGNRFVAHSPEVEGCVAIGGSREEVAKRMRDALRVHLGARWVKGPPTKKVRLAENAALVAEAITTWPQDARDTIASMAPTSETK